jgi:hypothetical protein
LSTEHTKPAGPTIDPATPEADVADFAAVIRDAFGDVVDEQHGPAGGYQWRWSNRGLWKISAGAVLDPQPFVEGPAGYWKIAKADRTGAEYALQVLAGAGALPPGVAPPAGTFYGSRHVQLRQGVRAMVRGRLYNATGPILEHEPVELIPQGPRQGDLQHIIAPGGSPAVLNVAGATFIVALESGRMGVVVVEGFAGLAEDAPIPAKLYPAALGAVPTPVRPRMASPTTPSAGMGPGAAYAPQVVDPGPVGGPGVFAGYGSACTPGEADDAMSRMPWIAGSDVPPRGADPLIIDDVGRPSQECPPAASSGPDPSDGCSYPTDPPPGE